MRFSHVGQSPLSTTAWRLAAWPGLPRSRCASPCRGMRKHTREHNGPATRGRGLYHPTAGALTGLEAGGQPPPLGIGAPAGSPPRARRGARCSRPQSYGGEENAGRGSARLARGRSRRCHLGPARRRLRAAAPTAESGRVVRSSGPYGQPFQHGHLCARSLAVETWCPF